MATTTENKAQLALQALNAHQPEQAITLLEELVTEFPENAAYWDHLLVAYTMTQQYAKAEDAYLKCEALGQVFPETLQNAALNADRWGNHQRLGAYAQRMLSLGGEFRLKGLIYHAQALWGSKQYEDSLRACEQLLSEYPDHFNANRVYIKSLTQMGKLTQALMHSNRLVSQHPTKPEAMIVQLESLIALGEIQQALVFAERWIQQNSTVLAPQIHSAFNFFSQFDPDLSVAQRRMRAQGFFDNISQRITPQTQWSNSPEPERVLNVGLLTGDLRNHPVGYFCQPLLEGGQDTGLRFTVFDTLNQGDEKSEQLKLLVDDWLKVDHLTNQDLVQVIQDHKIDILIDFHGHTTGQRLGVMAMHPAPVQIVGFYGFLGTTGLDKSHYVLTDDYCSPAGTEDEFTETVYKIPNYYCFSKPDVEFPTGPLPALSNGYVTFGSLNKPNKLNDKVLALWQQLLQRVPNSRLLLKGNGLNVPEYRKAFELRLLKNGFDLDRVILEGPAKRQEFLKTYQRIDIALDPFPYSGGTTSVETLWAGVPVLSIKGDRMIWRMAESFFNQVGLTDWLAEDAEDFLRLGAAKAADLEALAALREVQRSQVECSSLFDAKGYAEQLVNSLKTMWRTYCESQAQALDDELK